MTKDHGRTVIGQLAKDFKGYFQCDGFEGYESAFKANPNVRLVNCMAHIRRYFEQALAENRQMAEHALKEIQLLYRIEHDCDQMQLTENERMGKRQNLPAPLWMP